MQRRQPLEIWRQQNESVLAAFLPELANHLGRSESEVRQTGILGTEFPYQRVRIYYGDDRKAPESLFDFGFAFPVIAPHKEAIAVFAQNAGYYVFNHLCVVALRPNTRSRSERVIWGPENWWQHRDR